MTGTEALIAATLVSTGIGAASMVQQGRQAAAVGKYNQQVAEIEAQRTREAAKVEEDRLRRRVRALIGSQRVAAAGQGGTIDGSPMALIAETAQEAEIDAQLIRQAATAQAARYTAQGAISAAEGRAARMRAFTGAASTIVRGGATAYSLSRPAGVGDAPTMRRGIADDIAMMEGY